jgi:hypothetical protein
VGPVGAKAKSYFCSSIASATVASSIANWSPTHLGRRARQKDRDDEREVAGTKKTNKSGYRKYKNEVEEEGAQNQHAHTHTQIKKKRAQRIKMKRATTRKTRV